MSFVICEPCVGTEDRSCVEACPVGAIHEAEDQLVISAPQCIGCGACVPVCPAVAATGRETVSARAKLRLANHLTNGEDGVADEDLVGALRCLKCGQCAEVCARGLDLLGSWDELEDQVTRRLDAPDRIRQTIETFTTQIDCSRTRVLASALP